MIKMYKCDPEKNKDCRKRMCQNRCRSTSNPEYAELDSDGNPIVSYLRMDGCVPEIDLFRQVTGKWVRHYKRPGVYADLYWWCSFCNQPTQYQDAGIFYQYCPHCGAYMMKNK